MPPRPPLRSRSPQAPRWRRPSGTCPRPIPPTIFHTENIQQFANDVEKASGGKLKIQVHANASLLKMPEIKRGIQSGQVQIGEILLAAYANEDAMFELDGVPFLATSYADAMKLYKASKKPLEEHLAKQGIKLLYAVPWPPQGLFSKKEVKSAADMKGLKWRAYSPATAKIAELVNAQPVTIQQAELSPGARHRRGGFVHVLARDGL